MNEKALLRRGLFVWLRTRQANLSLPRHPRL